MISDSPYLRRNPWAAKRSTAVLSTRLGDSATCGTIVESSCIDPLSLSRRFFSARLRASRPLKYKIHYVLLQTIGNWVYILKLRHNHMILKKYSKKNKRWAKMAHNQWRVWFLIFIHWLWSTDLRWLGSVVCKKVNESLTVIYYWIYYTGQQKLKKVETLRLMYTISMIGVTLIPCMTLECLHHISLYS